MWLFARQSGSKSSHLWRDYRADGVPTGVGEVTLERGAVIYDYTSFTYKGYLSVYRYPERSMLWPHVDRWGPQFQLIVPLWIPPAAIFLFGLLFIRFSHPRPGRCSCGYSLAGLAPINGVVTCPECGRAQSQSHSA